MKQKLRPTESFNKKNTTSKKTKRILDDETSGLQQHRKMKHEINREEDNVLVTIQQSVRKETKKMNSCKAKQSRGGIIVRSSSQDMLVKPNNLQVTSRNRSVGPRLEIIPEMITPARKRSKSVKFQKVPHVNPKSLIRSASEAQKLHSKQLRRQDFEKIEKLLKERHKEVEKKVAVEEAKAKQETQFRARPISKGKPLIIKKSTFVTIPESPKLHKGYRAIMRNNGGCHEQQ